MSPAAFQKGQGEKKPNGDKLKALLSIAVILDALTKPGMLVEKYQPHFLRMLLSQEGCRLGRRRMNQEGKQQQQSQPERQGRKPHYCSSSPANHLYHHLRLTEGCRQGPHLGAQHPNSPISERTSNEHTNASSIQAPLPIWVTGSRPHDTH